MQKLTRMEWLGIGSGLILGMTVSGLFFLMVVGYMIGRLFLDDSVDEGGDSEVPQGRKSQMVDVKLPTWGIWILVIIIVYVVLSMSKANADCHMVDCEMQPDDLPVIYYDCELGICTTGYVLGHRHVALKTREAAVVWESDVAVGPEPNRFPGMATVICNRSFPVIEYEGPLPWKLDHGQQLYSDIDIYEIPFSWQALIWKTVCE